MKNILFTIKILSLIMTFSIFLFVFGFFEAYAESDSDFTLVGLKYSDTSIDSVTLESDKGLMIGKLSGKQITEISELPSIFKLQCKVIDGSIVLYNMDGSLINILDKTDNIVIMSKDYDVGGILFCENLPYRDGIALKINSLGKIDVLNRLKNQEYLYGVVHMEMSQANPIEALKAQAVAARNFLYLSRNRHQSDGFEVCNTTHCQVYGGFIKEYAKTNQAVDETIDKLIYCNNEPIVAYYHKNSGGYTQNSETVWSGILDYLRSIRDKYSPEYKWTFSLTKDLFTEKVKAAGLNSVGTIQTVSVTGLNPNGYVSEVELVGSSGSLKLTKEKTRAILGYTNIKSMNFNLSNSEAPIYLQGSYNSKTSTNSFNVISSEMDSRIILSSSTYVIDGMNNVSSISSKVVSNSDTIVFNGLGSGHGIGMSQDGAIEMAKQGFAYVDILKYYYTGVEIR